MLGFFFKSIFSLLNKEETQCVFITNYQLIHEVISLNQIVLSIEIFHLRFSINVVFSFVFQCFLI